MACTGPSGTLATKVMGQVAMQEEEQANKFTFDGDSSLSGGKTNVREAPLVAVALYDARAGANQHNQTVRRWT